VHRGRQQARRGTERARQGSLLLAILTSARRVKIPIRVPRTLLVLVPPGLLPWGWPSGVHERGRFAHLVEGSLGHAHRSLEGEFAHIHTHIHANIRTHIQTHTHTQTHTLRYIT